MELTTLSVILSALCLIGTFALAIAFTAHRNDSAQHGNTDHSKEIMALSEALELKEARIKKVESESAELHEFVNRNLKKMSTRARRAELLTQMTDELDDLEEDPDRSAQNQSEMNFGNKKPRLVRK